MEENNPNINELKPQDTNDMAYAVNIGVVVILILCVLGYLIIDNNLQSSNISSSVCSDISNNSKVFSGVYFGFVLFSQLISIILRKRKVDFQSKIWEIYSIFYIVSIMLYIPLNLFYLMIC